MNDIQQTLLEWHKTIDRDLPWKQTVNPYFIWLSEIILQQTRVKQGLPYYNKFVELFPTVFDLAKASQEEVFKAWEGLGYYSRARNLHNTAKFLVSEFEGVFPKDYDGLIKLKGIGPYTASAISSFAYGENKAVLDGNVFRVLSRLYNIDVDILSSGGKKLFAELADNLLPHGYSAHFNQAIMDFGALQCVPANPACLFCPLQDSCEARKNGTTHLRPVKKKAKAKKTRHLHFLVLKSKKAPFKTIIQKRIASDIWEGLFQFPCIETKTNTFPAQLEWEKLVGLSISIDNSEPIIEKQLLSHQEIRAAFQTATFEMKTEFRNSLEEPSSFYDNSNSDSYIYLEKSKLTAYAFPRIINTYLESLYEKK